ncbi:ATP-binding protein, partial [Nonomuraea rhizosphaerae]|uniref:ATP-binding protein n=1 Tax=Nonomuraea rhizosphaerae TaxID=2665663 RepID=UPI001C5EDECE
MAVRVGERSLLERSDEITALREAVDATPSGGGRLIVLQGPPGAGKTSLLTMAADRGRGSGLLVLEARGRELEREVALGVALELLTPPVAATAPGERARLVHGMAAPAAPLFPGILPSAGSATRPDTNVMLHGMCWLAANLAGWDRADARRPMLIAVDDAQWADEASLRFLAMLADRVGKLPVAMVVTVRDGETGSDVSALRALAARPPHRLMTPAPLSPAAVGRLVTGTFPDAGAGLAAAVAHASGGNPFLVGELLRSLQSDGGVPTADAVAGILPDTVLRSVLARLARLPADARGLAASAAVLGDGTPLRRAALHAGLELPSAERAADALAVARLLRPGDPLVFVHPLVAAAVHADLPAFARGRAHRRAADLLTADGEGVEKIAGHLLATRPEGDPGVARVLREAAGRAVRRGDPAAAVRLLRRALPDETAGERRGELLVELAHAQLVAGDMGALASVTEGLALLGEPSPDKLRALNLLTQIRHARDDVAGTVTAHREALALLEPGSAKWQNALAGYLMVSTFHPPLRGDGERLLAPVLAEARRGRPPDQPGLLAHVTLRLALAGDPPADVRRMAALALARDPLVGRSAHGGLLGIVVHSLVMAGELTAAEAAADAALSAAGSRGVF